MIAYLASFMLGATAIVAAPQTQTATTPDIAPGEFVAADTTTDPTDLQGTAQFLRVYGNPVWDVAGAGTAAINADNQNLGEFEEWENIAPSQGDDKFDQLFFEPAYDEDTRISPGDDGDVDNIATHLSGQYHPIVWLPATTCATEHCFTEPMSTSGIFDVNSDGIFDFDQIDDEDFDASLDTSSSDDPIDLLGVDDNLPDIASRNDDTGAADDIYFPGWIWRYVINGFTTADVLTDIHEGDEIKFPVSGLGGQPGLNSFEAVEGQGDETVLVQDISNPDTTEDSGDDQMRLELQNLRLEEGETVRFWDFQAEILAINDVVGNPDDVRMRISWLGDFDNPQEVGSDVTGEADDVIRASRTSTTSVAGDCDVAEGADGGRPDADAERPWYVCIETISATADPPIIFLTVGRVFSDRLSEEDVANIMVNGAYYSFYDIVVGGVDDGSMDRVVLDRVVPFGDDVQLDGLGAVLSGTAADSALPVDPPFNMDHTALENYDVPVEPDTYGFLQDVDGDTEGTSDPDIIEQDDIDVDDDFRGVEDRQVDRGPLDISWVVQARNTGFLANMELPLPDSADWGTQINHLYPNHYVEMDMPAEGKVLVDSGVFEDSADGRDSMVELFLWDPADPTAIQWHFGDSVKLYGEPLEADADTTGDRLLVNPAIVTVGDVKAGGTNADLLAELSLEYCPFCVFDDIALGTPADDGDAADTADDESADGETDLNVLTDEEEQAAGGDSRDPDSVHHPIDDDGDNLFDLEGDQNNDDDEGDIYAPAIRQVYVLSFVNQGTGVPMEADLPASGINLGPDPSDSETKATFSLATDTHDGGGLDSADLDGDGDVDETFVQAIHTTEDTQQSATAGGVGLIQLETEALNIGIGDRAQLMDYEVEVQTTDTSYGPSARLAIYQVDESGVTNDDVATFTFAQAGDYVGVRHAYATGEATALGPAECIDTDGATAAGDCADGDGEVDMDWYVRVNNIASDSVTLVAGTFLPGGLERFVDGQMYLFTGSEGDGATPRTTIQTVTLETRTPIGDDVEMQEPPIVIDAIEPGDVVPLLTPFNADHQIVDNINPALEQDEFGRFNPDVDSDGDATDEDSKDRILDVGPLDVTVSSTGRNLHNMFVGFDTTKADGDGLQIAANFFPGASRDDDAGDEDGTTEECDDEGDDEIGEGEACAGWPDPAFANVPGPTDYEGSFLDGWDFEIDNDDRGSLHYVALDVPSGHGQYILEMAMVDEDTGGSDTNVYEWPAVEPATDIDVGDCETAGDLTGGGPVGLLPCIGVFGEDAEGPDDEQAWFVFSSSDALGIFLGDGTAPAGQTLTPEEEAEQGRNAAFDVTALSCSPSQVTAGQAISCTATVQNTGNDAGSATVRLRATHQGSHMTDQVVAQGVSDNVAIDGTDDVLLLWSTSTADEGGTYQLTAASSSTDVTKSTTVTLTEAAGVGDADISVQSCSVSGTIAPGETIVGSATFVNNGDVAGSDSFNVLANGNPAASVSSGNVPAGDTRTQSVSITLGEGVISAPDPGESTTVTVSVGGVNCGGSIAVEAPAEPDQPVIPGFEVAALLTAVGAALLLLRRREL